MKRLFQVFSVFAILALLLAALPMQSSVQALSPDIVISQVYGGGGNSGGIYTNDFVELFNRGTSTVSLDGWSIQYTSATGTGNFGSATNLITPLSGSLAPGQYLLVQEAAGTNIIASLPTPDLTDATPINMSGTGGKVALVMSVSGLGCNGSSTICTAAQLALIKDLVGWDGANFYETAAAPATTNATAVIRNSNGCAETDNNSADFAATTPAPRNSASPTAACSAPTPTVNLSVSTNSASETDQTVVTVTATASAAVTGDQTVDVGVSGAGLTTGDYSLSGSIITILDGQTTGFVTFAVVDDTEVEGAETATLAISNPSAGIALGATLSQDVVIADNDAPAVAPAITTQPQNQAIVSGGTATLSVVASGTEPLTYQWYQGNSGDTSAPVGANSASYTTPALSATTSYWVRVSNSAGSVDSETATVTVSSVCDLPFTSIPSIQGSGPSAAITGSVTTQGVVVGDNEGASPTLRGFFLQDLSGDANPATSDGIFVFNGNSNSVNLGDVVRVTGTASDYQGQTQISAVTASIVNCGAGTVTPVDVTLPFASADAAEAYEGMLVRLPQTLYVTEHYQLGRFGQVVLSSSARLKQPTNVVLPGAPALALQAQNNLNRIIVDDALNNQNADPIVFGRNGLPLSAANTLRGGDTATGIVGIMTYTWGGNSASPNAYRVRPINALGGTINFVAGNPRPTSVPVVGGTVKVVGMNLLNFYNTFSGCTYGVGGAAGDCRGATSQSEFDRQWPKTVSAITAMNADVIGFNEIENDGYGPESAIAFLVDKLNAATAPGTYAFVDADAATGQVNALGTDGIKVGMIYKPAVVTLVGQTAALNTTPFVNGGDSAPRNRVSLLQAFEVNTTGARFLVNINHLKSKGSACDAPDAGDGQGNCNIVRVNAANELLSWFASDPTGTSDPDLLMLGDYNSYAKEDPITALVNGGFTNLVEDFIGEDAYSYVFDGQWGYLDQALGSPSIISQISGVADYHINADEPSVLDYLEDYKSAGQLISLYAPDQFRISDHDPVIVGLNPTVPNAAPSVDAGGPYIVDEGASVTLTASGTDPENQPLTYAWDLDNSGTFETPNQSVAFAGLDGPADYTVSVQVTDNGGLMATAQAAVHVNNLAPTATFTAPASADEGSSFTLALTNPTDVTTDLGSLEYAFDCGSGYGAFGASSSASCPTTDNGSLPVGGKVMDKDGGVTEYTATVTVNNLAPTATFTAPASADEGSSFTLALTSPADVAADLGSLQYAFDCGAGYGAFGASSSATCAAADNGALTVGGKVMDKDGGVSEYSATVTVNNLAPVVGPITAPTSPAKVNTAINASASFTDAGSLDTHTALWSWGDGTTSNGVVTEVNGSGSVSGSHAYAKAGLYKITLTVTDKDGGSQQATFETVIVYNPNGGFATGAGWVTSPAGAYLEKPTKAGPAAIAFAVKYAKNATKPTGSFDFVFLAGGLQFKASSFDWLVVNLTSKTAQFQGSGKINGKGSYKFMVWATDGSPDSFRLKIWKLDGTVVYDSGVNLPLLNGAIVVHQ